MEENRLGLTDMMMVAFSKRPPEERVLELAPKGEKLLKEMEPRDRRQLGQWPCDQSAGELAHVLGRRRGGAGKSAGDAAPYSQDHAFLGNPDGLKKASGFFLQTIGKQTSRKGQCEPLN